MSRSKGFPIVSVALSFLLVRSAAAQGDPGMESQVEPAASDVPVASDAPAPSPAPLPLDGGPFPFLAASLGVGELWIDNGTHQTWGRTVPFEISGGVTVAPNVAVFAAVYGARVVLPVSDDSRTNSLDLYGAGPGVKVHLAGPNIVVAGWAAISRLHIDHDAYPDETSRWGVLGRLSVGRQWSASPHWWLGLAGELTVGRMGWAGTEEPLPDAYVSKGFSLVFSGGVGGATSGAAAAGVVASGERAAGERAHDGYFLNASVGLGKAWLTGGLGGVDISGAATSLDLSAGYAITGSLVLFGAFYELYAAKPAYSIANLADLELHGFGPGARYYVTPFNVFFEGALLVSRLGYHNLLPADGRYGINQTSDWRPIGRAAIGWEGWIAANWGLGAACEGIFGRLPSRVSPSEDSGPSYTMKGLSLLLSASFN